MIASFTLSGQEKRFSISGKIVDEKGSALPGVNIIDSTHSLGTASDIQGNFVLNNLAPNEYTLLFSAIGFKSVIIKLNLIEDIHLKEPVVMNERAISLGEVTVKTNSLAREIEIRGYTVNVIENKKTHNLPEDINGVLRRTSGINIRESGGLGSDFKLSLNGLSGNQIRYFIDGVPMENMGSALSLNNFPVNLIENIEIYKGVVPVSLGADALGGAINILSGFRQKSFLDAALSYGSFNTTRLSINGQYADDELGYYLKSLIYSNYSKNNFEVKNVPVYDLELGNFLGNKTVNRFHDDFKSAMILAEAGLFDKNFADKIALKVIVAGNRKNYQHPDNNIKRIFGEFHTKNSSLLFSGDYNKRIEDLNVSANLTTGIISESVIDTSRKKYNWAGDFLYREADDPRGELLERRSHMELEDFIFRSGISAKYNLTDNQSVTTAFNQNYLNRTGDEKVDLFNRSYQTPNYIRKNIFGLEFSHREENGMYEISLFGKGYYYRGKIITFDYEDNEIIDEPQLEHYGYGGAISWFLNTNVLLKTSYELAYRIPESFEILGDGIYVNPNPLLNPEKSNNFNMGLKFDSDSDILAVKSELNYFYRFSKDFIRFNPLGPFGEYENLNNVKSEGIETGLDINYDKLVTLNTNITYQNITDQSETDEGLQNTNYRSRVPNIPYFFCNGGVGYHPLRNSENFAFHIYYKFSYVHEFFLTWENLGAQDDKYTIPTQFVQDFLIECSFDEGRYNISTGVFNFLDAEVYDNFLIRKPGRSYSLKLRYFLK